MAAAPGCRVVYADNDPSGSAAGATALTRHGAVDGALTVGQMNEPAVAPARPEYVTPGWAERLARSIAPIRDISDDEEDAGLPGTCRLLDVLGLDGKGSPPPSGRPAAAP